MFDFDLSGKNKYYTLYLKIREEILRGKVTAGEKLPSKRALAENLGVSVITVQRALEQLLAEGYIVSKERSGYFVGDVTPTKTQKKKDYIQKAKESENYKIDFVKGSAPASLFPFATWARLIRAVLLDCGEHLLERVPCDGDGELKREIASYLYRARGIEVEPRYIVIGAGAEYLYGLLVQLIGRDKLIAVENPGYKLISATYKMNGATCLPIPVTDTGISLEGVENSRAHIVHISPSHQFPTGAVMGIPQRQRLVDWAESSGGYIVEDDYDSEFRLTGKPLQSTYSLLPDRVIYINTFSKSLAPSMRLGYMILPPKLYEKYLKLFSSSANTVSLFEQKTLAKMLQGGFFERHISRLKTHYRYEREAILKFIGEKFPDCIPRDTGSGLHMTAYFPNAESDEEIKVKAAELGIKIKCLTDYLVSPLEGMEKTAVINYSGITTEDLKI